MSKRLPAELRCTRCGVRNHALGGWSKSDGAFMLAVPDVDAAGRVSWPRAGSDAWCGSSADGEVQRCRIIRITLTRLKQGIAALCQHCLNAHDTCHAADLFQGAQL